MPASQPNLLVLLCDQLQRDLLGPYGGGVRTPNWQRLANQGVVFDRCYCATPLCVPTRPSMMGGRYPNSHGAISFGEGFDTMHSGEEILPDRLLDAGYRVGYDGIWHVNRRPEDDRSDEFAHFKPGQFPYQDHLRMLIEQGGEDGQQNAPVRTPTDEGGYHDWRFSVPVPARWTDPIEEHPEMRRAATMAEFIRSSPAEQPFAAWCAFGAPHPPIVVPEPYFSLFSPDDMEPPPGFGEAMDELPEAVRDSPGAQSVRGWTWEQWSKAIAAYRGFVAFADACFGVVMEALEESGRLGDTFVLASCDHGEMLGAHNLYQKGVLYEQAIAIPFILAGPDVPPGRRDQLVSQVDFAPTLLDLMELPPLPEAQGESLLPVLRNPSQPGRDYVFAEFNGCILGGAHVRAAISRQHKYLYYDDGSEQLFDLERDPGELTNLATSPEHSQVRHELGRALRAWMQDTGDFMAPPPASG